MPRKNRPVLYEVVRRRGPRDLFWKRAVPPTAAADRPETLTPPPLSQPAHVSAPPRPQPPAPAPRAGAAPARPRSVRIDDGKVFLTLGWQQLTIVGVLLLILAVVVFQAGKLYATKVAATTTTNDQVYDPPPTKPETPPDKPKGDTETPPSGETGAVHRGPRGSSVATPPRRGEDSPPKVEAKLETPPANPPTPPKSERPKHDFQVGATYLVIQHFPKSKLEDADKAAEFLKSKGIDCVVESRKDEHVLTATQAFRLDQKGGDLQREKQRLEQLRTRVKELGREYFMIGGWSFEKCYSQNR